MISGRTVTVGSAVGLFLSACGVEPVDGSPAGGASGMAGAGGGAGAPAEVAGGGAGGTAPGAAGAVGVAGMTTGGMTGASGNSAGGASAGTDGGGMGGGVDVAGAGGAEGGAATGGAATGGAETGGAETGGAGSEPSVPGAIPLGNDPVKSAGCGSMPTLTAGKHTIMSTGQQRSYIIDIPNGYDMDEPHRLFYTSHWIGSTSEAVRDQNYYFLKPLAQRDGVPAIFVAPQSDGDRWQEKDHALFDDLLALVKEDLCIDTTRVFATGFSFGGMITYSLSVNHQKDIRAAVGIAPANYNIYVPPRTGEPIAWMQTTGMNDGTCPWVQQNSVTNGAKFIAIEHATDNGCEVPNDLPTWQNGGHLCYDFEGCPSEYPTKACTFNGDHTNISNENGQNWIPNESWDFFMQF